MSGPRLRAVIAALALVMVAGACSRGSSATTGRLAVLGTAEIERGTSWQPVSASRTLHPGERLRVRDGTAVVRLSANRRLELREGSQIELKEGDDGVHAVLVGGDLLVVAPDRPLTVEVSGGDVTVNGTARVSRGNALLVATYERAATLDAGGRSLTVPALRQAAIGADGAVPIRATPLQYSAADTWDERYLADAYDLGNQLDSRSRGFTAQLAAGEGRTPGFFRDLLPGLANEQAFDGLFDANRPPGETLIGAAITTEGSRDSFTGRWTAVFAFHDDGAPWGLVALDQQVAREPLLAAVDAAIRRRPTQFAQAPRAGMPTPTVPTTVPPTTPPTTAAPPTTAPVVNPRPPATTTTTTPPAPPSGGTDGPLRTGIPPVDNTVNSLVDTLIALLRSLGGG